MRTLFAVVLVACQAPTSPPQEEPAATEDVLDWVDPFIGSGGQIAQVSGINPGASAPTGMTLVGPDTRDSSFGQLPFNHYGGYHYDDDLIDGFSHTHSHGMGVNDYGGVHVAFRAQWDDSYITSLGRKATIDKESERARPGSYGVVLSDDGTEVEIVATTRGAHHRLTFEPGNEPVVVLDLGYTIAAQFNSISMEEAWAERSGNEVVGYQRLAGAYSGRFGGLQTHFVMQFDPEPVASGSWDGDTVTADRNRAEGTSSGLFVQFPAGTEQVEVRVALSYVDLEGAKNNLASELDGITFEEQTEIVESLWRERLERLEVEGGREDQRRRLHTAHYHTLLMPSRFQDVDGRYRGLDGEVHTADFAYFSDLSLWDTFRTLHPWWTLAHSDLQRDVLRSLVRMTEDGGKLPRWPLGHGYTGGMIGQPTAQVFSQSAAAGIDGWDQEKAFAISYESATSSESPRAGNAAYTTQGWVPADEVGMSASRTLEFAWSDAALADWATRLGYTEEAKVLQKQSQAWKNIWDEEQRFFRGRNRDGSFVEFRGPTSWADDFTEGNPWHYKFMVPADVPGMIEVQNDGDREAFLDELENYWFLVMSEEEDLQPDDFYWHGNEPVMHVAALGGLAGDRTLTSHATRWVLEQKYPATVTGLDGNDDSGTLSAWFILGALGLHPVAGFDAFVPSAPIFERATVRAPDRVFTIDAPGTSATRWVPTVLVGNDANPIEGVLTHEDLRGTLHHFLSTAQDPE